MGLGNLGSGFQVQGLKCYRALPPAGLLLRKVD